jgi:hypothetical protein
MIDFRNQARGYLKQAKAELTTGDDVRLRYAALDLRFAMEALTYDRARAYKDELPPSEYDTWQPRKLMVLLLEIDPNADKDSFLSVGIEEHYGVPAPVMTALGAETVLNLAVLKKHYDAIGNFLHVPTLKQAETSPPVPAKLRERCEEVAAYIEKVLASPVWNATFGNFASMQCENCGATIRKRIPHGQEKLTAKCFECPATYTVTDAGKGKVYWKLDMVDVPCGNKECGHVIHILPAELKPGSTWTCAACSGTNVIALSVKHELATNGDV